MHLNKLNFIRSKNFSRIGYLWSLDPSTWPEGWVSFWPVSPPFSIFDPSNFFLPTKRIIIFSLSFVTSKKSQASLLFIYADRIKIVHRFLLQNGVWKVLWIRAPNIIFKHIYLRKNLHMDFKIMATFNQILGNASFYLFENMIFIVCFAHQQVTFSIYRFLSWILVLSQNLKSEVKFLWSLRLTW